MKTEIIYWIDYIITTNPNTYNMQIDDMIFHLSPPEDDMISVLKTQKVHKISYRGEPIFSVGEFHSLMKPLMQIEVELLIKPIRDTNNWKINISPLSAPFDELEINCLKYLWY